MSDTKWKKVKSLKFGSVFKKRLDRDLNRESKNQRVDEFDEKNVSAELETVHNDATIKSDPHGDPQDIIETIMRRLSICSTTTVELVTINNDIDDEEKELSQKINDLLELKVVNKNLDIEQNRLSRKKSMSVKRLDVVLTNVQDFLQEISEPVEELKRSKTVNLSRISSTTLKNEQERGELYKWRTGPALNNIRRAATVKITGNNGGNSLQDRLKNTARMHTVTVKRAEEPIVQEVIVEDEIDSDPIIANESDKIQQGNVESIKIDEINQGSVESIKSKESNQGSLDSINIDETKVSEAALGQDTVIIVATTEDNENAGLNEVVEDKKQELHVIDSPCADKELIIAENIEQTHNNIPDLVSNPTIRVEPTTFENVKRERANSTISTQDQDVTDQELIQLARKMSAHLDNESFDYSDSADPDSEFEVVTIAEVELAQPKSDSETTERAPATKQFKEATLDDIFDILEVMEMRKMLNQRAVLTGHQKVAKTPEPLTEESLNDIFDILDSMQKRNMQDQRAMDPITRKRQKLDGILNTMVESIANLEKSNVSASTLNELYQSINKIRTQAENLETLQEANLKKASPTTRGRKWLKRVLSSNK